MRLSTQLVNRMPLDRDLVLEFIVLFAGTEAALKRAGYAAIDAQGKLSVTWGRFAQAIEERFRAQRSPELQEAVAALRALPPLKQTLRNGRLAWEPERPFGEPSLKWLLRAVRRARKNLFHGGRYPGLVAANPQRAAEVLRSCIIILETCLELDSAVCQYLEQDLDED